LSYFLRFLVLQLLNLRPDADFTPRDGLFFKLNPAPEQVPNDLDFFLFAFMVSKI